MWEKVTLSSTSRVEFVVNNNADANVFNDTNLYENMETIDRFYA